MSNDSVMMTYNVLELYQQFTRSTNICNPICENTKAYIETGHLVFGLCAEAGEVASKYQKLYRKIGTNSTISDLDLKNLSLNVQLELGDVLYHVSELCNLLGVSIEDVIHMNMEKLTSRKERGTIQGDGDHR